MSASDARTLGQLLILGLRDHRWSSSLERTLRTLQPGGVLFSPGCFRTPGQTVELLHRIARELSTTPFLALTEEGGSVNPLKALLPPLPAPRVLACRRPAAVQRSGELMGNALRLLGCNLNFAPRLDLSNPDVEPALDTQTFGTDPKHVATCGKAFIEGLRTPKILAGAKHFPGRSVPEHNEGGLPLVGETMAKLWREDMLPFRGLLPQLPMILMSNAAYKAYDFDHPRPASLSRQIITGLLRVKLAYRGLTLAYDLAATAARGGLDFGEAVIAAATAGCDLMLADQEESIEIGRRSLEAALASGKLLPERVEESISRIRAGQKGLRRPSGKLSARSFDRLAREFEEFSHQVRAGGEIEA